MSRTTRYVMRLLIRLITHWDKAATAMTRPISTKMRKMPGKSTLPGPTM